MQEHNNMTCSTTRSVFFLCFVGGIKAWLINQPAALQTVELGDSVTIECYLPKKDFNSMVWYKQELGMMPEPVAKDYNYLQDVTSPVQQSNGSTESCCESILPRR
ncbi:hypothetical protein SRHO_G00023100 [Serrasalmus rhombeus]